MNWLRALALILVFLPEAVMAQAHVEDGGAPAAPANSDTAGTASPETAESSDPEVAAMIARLKAAYAAKEAEGDSESTRSKPATPPASASFTEETSAAYQKAWQAYYAYRTDGYSHRQKVFEWQDLSTKIIFVVVVFLVLAGVYFAAVQFHVGLRAKLEPTEASEVELSVKGVKVRSPVLGVIVLTISLAFFYLYLIYVYPIQNVF